MKRVNFRKVIFLAMICAMVVGFIVSGARTNVANSTEYKCDVKNFRFSTTIEIDKEKQPFAKVKGKMLDANEKLIATFHSRLFLNDFTVNIAENCKLDEKTVLMIFSSYYSDQAADKAK